MSNEDKSFLEQVRDHANWIGKVAEHVAPVAGPADAVRPLTREELDFDVRRIREYFEMLRVEIAGDSRIASDGEGPWLSAVTSSFNRIESAARASVEAQEDAAVCEPPLHRFPASHTPTNCWCGGVKATGGTRFVRICSGRGSPNGETK